MIEGKFDIVFRGQVVKQFELAEVKSNLVNLFKSSPEAIEKLFLGSEVTIRKGVSYADAMKYQSALKKAGALALIKEIIEEPNHTDVSTSLHKKNSPDAKKGSSDTANPSATPIVKPVATPAPCESQTLTEGTNEEQLTIAQVGAQILPPKKYEKRVVDTSQLSLAEAGEPILSPKSPKKYDQPSIDHLSLE